MSGTGVSLLALLLSTVAYGVASALQAVGVTRARAGAAGDAGPGDAGAGGGGPALLPLRAMASLPFLAGTGLDLVGVGLGSVALRELPLFVVQAAGVASVGVTGLLALLAGQRLDRVRLGLGLLAGTAGCALLAAAADPAPATPLPDGVRVALAAALPATAVLALAALRQAPRAQGLVLTALAGLIFGAVGLCLRGGAGPEAGLVSTGLVTAVVLGVTGTALFAVALDRCPVTEASGVLALTELVVPATVGLLALGDRVLPGLELAALSGGALVALAVVQLARAEVVEGDPSPARTLERTVTWTTAGRAARPGHARLPAASRA